MIHKRGDLGRADLVHGHRIALTPTYYSWMSMKARCRFPSHPAYHRYGGRGIVVCERWLTFENFLADMGERPPNLELYRIDNDGNYEPSNCRWGTSKENANNRCNSRRRA